MEWIALKDQWPEIEKPCLVYFKDRPKTHITKQEFDMAYWYCVCSICRQWPDGAYPTCCDESKMWTCFDQEHITHWCYPEIPVVTEEK